MFRYLLLLLFASQAYAAAPQTIRAYCLAHPDECTRGPIAMLAAESTTDSLEYMLQVDSTTGRLLTDVALSNDTNYGVVGANTLRTAAQIGNATGAADFNAGAAGAQTLRVALATGGSAIGFKGSTFSNVFTRNDYTSVNVTTAAYVQLVASTTSATNRIIIFDSSGQTMKLATGGAGAEVDQFVIPPGGIDIPYSVAAGTRLSLRAISATAAVGEIDLNYLQ